MKKINLVFFLFYLSVCLPSNTMWTPLHQVAKEGNLQNLQDLLDAGENFNVTDQYGNTPLHWAAFHNHTDVITFLINKGTPINTPNRYGWTPLHLAAFNGQRAACSLLINEKTINSTDKYNQTPLDNALLNGHAMAAHLLLQEGAAINVNLIVLRWKIIRNHQEVINLLHAALLQNQNT